MSSCITSHLTVATYPGQRDSKQISAQFRPAARLQPFKAQAVPSAWLSQLSLGARRVTSSLRSQQSLVPSAPAELQTADLHALADYKQLLLLLAASGAFISVTDVAGAADAQFATDLSLAKIDSSQVIAFFVNNPFITLGAAVAAYFIVPRIIKLAVKFVVVPLAIGGVGYLVVTNPGTSASVAKTGIGCESLLMHPYARSCNQACMLYTS